MPCQHTNRRGETYHLQSGRTKTGKTHYYMGRKVTGTVEERVPAGYEIWENPESAQVHVRKERASPIIAAEREFLEKAIRTAAGLEHFIVEVENRSLVVYVIDRDPDEAARRMSDSLGGDRFRAAREHFATCANYQKMMRFTLVDEDERLFWVERWCFLGSIDNWFPLGGRGALPELAAQYVPHLGKESFFELMM